MGTTSGTRVSERDVACVGLALLLAGSAASRLFEIPRARDAIAAAVLESCLVMLFARRPTRRVALALVAVTSAALLVLASLAPGAGVSRWMPGAGPVIAAIGDGAPWIASWFVCGAVLLAAPVDGSADL